MPEVPANAHRNFAQETSSSWSKPYTNFNGGINSCADLGKVITDGMQVGDTVRSRIILKYDNIVPAEGKTVKCWWQGSGNVTVWGDGGFPNTGGQKVLNGSGEIVFEGTDTIKSNHLKNAYWSCNIRFDYVASGSIQWKEEKVEIGKSFTPYTPAPEQLGWSTDTLVPTQQQRYLWKFEYIYYSDGSVENTQPVNLSIAGADADTTGITEELDKIAEEVANSKAEIETQIETAKTQAESNAKEYADTINQETAKVAELANAAAGEIKADLVNVKNNLTSTSLVANNAQAAVDAAKRDLANVTSDLNTAKQDLTNSVAEVNTKVDNTKAELTQAKQELTNVANDLSQAKTDLQTAVSEVDTKATNLKSDLSQAKQDLTSQAQQLQAQADAQTELTKRVTTVETTANGTKTTVSELGKTVAQNGKDITSVTNRTKTVEDDLANTKTTVSQVKTTADSTSQKTATLETGLNGLNAKFDSLKIGAVNLLHNSKGPFQPKNSRLDNYTVYKNTWINMEQGKEYTLSAKGTAPFTSKHATDKEKNEICLWLVNDSDINRIISSSTTGTVGTKFIWNDPSGKYRLRVNTYKVDNSNYVEEVQIEEGNLRSTYSQNESDIESKVAEYKQNADQNYASLQTTVQNLDGTVQHNKTVADQTAQGFTTRIESLETYKDGESERANAYFESAKTETAKQLTAERTAIANNYVAKSTYTSDVTGIRNELSATTSTANATKTNLANYQASNDRAVANLQSNLQTANGNISSLKTKVEAVPGQITSAVSAVEGKIPTSVGGRNLIIRSQIQNGYIDNIGYLVSSNDHFTTGFIDATNNKQFTITAPKNGGGLLVLFRLVKYGADKNFLGRDVFSYTQDAKTVKTITLADNVAYFKVSFDGVYKEPFKIERGNLPTDWSPAPEDTAEQISSLSSEIKQTADGITLLATKTELNNAKNELQSGVNAATNKANSAQSTANNNAQTISTHTTQISALNTGLQAKVSQTDFNTLSGRVTTAENNITAKANELSSKITSVEGKIPTSVGGRNLYALSQNSPLPSNNIGDLKQDLKTGEISFKVTGRDPYFGLQANKDEAVGNRGVKIPVKKGQDIAVQLTNELFAKNFVSYFGDDDRAVKNFKGYQTNKFVIPAGELAGVSYVTFRFGLVQDTQEVGSVHSTKVKVEYGNVYTDWSPAPEDTATQISNLSSEIKQTADGITLLATKTELNTAKNELQSGVNAATNKANSAQSTANSNAQTISTHTTQISALNTGLQAKVSQTDFNTLSGRVTTAENNITAKANELSSKITSVEGKIPTEIGGRNLYALSKNSPIWSNEISNLVQNVATGEISFKVTGRDPHFGAQANKGEAFGTSRGVKIPVKAGQGMAVQLTNELFVKNFVSYFGDDDRAVKNCKGYHTNKFVIPASELEGVSYVSFRFGIKENTQEIGSVHSTKIKVEYGNVFTDWSPAPEDTAEQISSLSSEIKQTADGITLLATKTELNTAKNELQSGVNAATNKANSAQSTANSNAQTISTHTTQISALNTGLQAKVSQSEFNTLSGRVTTAENNITAKANELSSKITSVEGKIPSGEMNLVEYGRPADGYNRYAGAEYATHPYYYNGAYKMYIIKNSTTSEKMLGMNRFKVERNTDYTLYFKGFNNDNITHMDVWFLKRVNGSKNDYDSAQQLVIGRKLSDSRAEDVSVTFNTGNYDEGYLRFDNNGTATAGSQADLYFGDVSVKKGKSNNGWSPSLAELATSQDLKNAQSEFKQTTDSIKASVTSLDKSTVKSSSLTINSDGIVMKAGKSTTDVANAIGSYFAVNQNAINLFSDKINVKGNMIVNGAITSDKIASKQINTAHLNGKIITADVISSNAVTADAIKAGAVTTDKMSANSINGDRITAGTLDAAKIKAGSISASQIASGTLTSAQIKAGAIKSINIEASAITSDKIAANAITGDKIKANSVDVSKIVGIDADFIKSKIEYAMIDWLKGKTITAYNDNMTIDLQDGRISFKDGSNAVYRQTPDGIHTGFLHFEAGSQGGIYAAFGATSTRQGINSKSSEFAGIRCYRVSKDGDSHDAKIDKIEVIGDTVQFGHGYRSDGTIGGGFIMDTAAYANETPYSLNRVVKSIESLWRILHDHAKNTGYRFNDPAFINALNNEYNAWHELHND